MNGMGKGIDFVRLSFFLLSLGLSFVLFLTFLQAYVNGGRVTVCINAFGEAKMEFLFLILFMGFSPVVALHWIREFKR